MAKEKRLVLTCPNCGQRALYGGYPSDPILSQVVCLHCGHAGPGGTFKHHHPKGERCAKAPAKGGG